MLQRETNRSYDNVLNSVEKDLQEPMQYIATCYKVVNLLASGARLK